MTGAHVQDRTLLLILPSKREIYPLSTAALSQAQATKAELKEYIGALVLDQDGTARRIERIEILGPWGESMARRVLSLLTSGWRIDVKLSEPLARQLEKLKELVSECIAAHGDLGFPAMEEHPSLKRTTADWILEVDNVGEIFDILDVPPPEESLDVL